MGEGPNPLQERVLWTEKSATYNNLAGNHVWEWCGRLGMECVWTSGQKCVLGKIAFWAKVILGKSASGQKCVWAKPAYGTSTLKLDLITTGLLLGGPPERREQRAAVRS